MFLNTSTLMWMLPWLRIILNELWIMMSEKVRGININFTSKALEYWAKTTPKVSLSQYFWSSLYTHPFTNTEAAPSRYRPFNKHNCWTYKGLNSIEPGLHRRLSHVDDPVGCRQIQRLIIALWWVALNSSQSSPEWKNLHLNPMYSVLLNTAGNTSTQSHTWNIMIRRWCCNKVLKVSILHWLVSG